MLNSDVFAANTNDFSRIAFNITKLYIEQNKDVKNKETIRQFTNDYYNTIYTVQKELNAIVSSKKVN